LDLCEKFLSIGTCDLLTGYEQRVFINRSGEAIINRIDDMKISSAFGERNIIFSPEPIKRNAMSDIVDTPASTTTSTTTGNETVTIGERSLKKNMIRLKSSAPIFEPKRKLTKPLAFKSR